MLEEVARRHLEGGHSEFVEDLAQHRLLLLLGGGVGQQVLGQQQLPEGGAALGDAGADLVVAGPLGARAQVGVDGMPELVRLSVHVADQAVEALQHVGGAAVEPGGTERPADLSLTHLSVDVPRLMHVLRVLPEFRVERGVGIDDVLPGVLPRVLLARIIRQGGDYVPVPQLGQGHQLRLDRKIPPVYIHVLLHGPHEGMHCAFLDVIGHQALRHHRGILPPFAHLDVVRAHRAERGRPHDVVLSQYVIDDAVGLFADVPAGVLVEADHLAVRQLLLLAVDGDPERTGAEPIPLQLGPCIDAVLVLGHHELLSHLGQLVRHPSDDSLQQMAELLQFRRLHQLRPGGEKLSQLQVHECELLAGADARSSHGVVELLRHRIGGVRRVTQVAEHGRPFVLE